MALDLMSPQQLVAEARAAGAEFRLNRRVDSLTATYVYTVRPGGDLARCREIIASAKSRPPQFYEAFRAEAQRVAGEHEEGQP